MKLSIKKYVRAVGVSFLMSLLIAGCGGSSDKVQLSQIEGVWGDSDTNDVGYLVINSLGGLSFYDYQADAVGTGENCYLIQSLDSDLSSLSATPSGSSFDLTFRGTGFNGIIESGISVSADGQRLSLWTEFHEGSARLAAAPGTVVITADRSVEPEVLQRVQGVAQADLNVCTGSSAIQNDDSGFSTNAGSSSLRSAFKALLRGFDDQFDE